MPRSAYTLEFRLEPRGEPYTLIFGTWARAQEYVAEKYTKVEWFTPRKEDELQGRCEWHGDGYALRLRRMEIR